MFLIIASAPLLHFCGNTIPLISTVAGSFAGDWERYGWDFYRPGFNPTFLYSNRFSPPSLELSGGAGAAAGVSLCLALSLHPVGSPPRNEFIASVSFHCTLSEGGGKKKFDKLTTFEGIHLPPQKMNFRQAWALSK